MNVFTVYFRQGFVCELQTMVYTFVSFLSDFIIFSQHTYTVQCQEV